MSILCSIGFHDGYHPKQKELAMFGYVSYAPAIITFCTRCGKGRLDGCTFWSMPSEDMASIARKLAYG